MADITQDDVRTTLSKAPWTMVTTARTDGKLLSHPMVPQQVTADCDIWFFISRTGDQADVLHQGPHVNVAVDEAGSWLSVAGTAAFVDDAAKVDELWNDDVAAWFPGGRTDPDLGLLKVTTDTAQYWGTPGGKARGILEIAKAKVTGEKTGGGTRTVDL